MPLPTLARPLLAPQADRLFYSIQSSWEGASRGGLADIKELIPEFFYLPDFLQNINNVDLGTRTHTGERLQHVSLPAWAHGDSAQFIAQHRGALEGEYVSAHLHEWIDLIFGYKQQGLEAERALNVFHPLTYESGVVGALKGAQSERERQAITSQIAHFGQTPAALFQNPHVRRMRKSRPPPAAPGPETLGWVSPGAMSASFSSVPPPVPGLHLCGTPSCGHSSPDGLPTRPNFNAHIVFFCVTPSGRPSSPHSPPPNKPRPHHHSQCYGLCG